jgi:hypothetical protein
MKIGVKGFYWAVDLLLGLSTALYLQWVCGGLHALVQQFSSVRRAEGVATCCCGFTISRTRCANDFPTLCLYNRSRPIERVLPLLMLAAERFFTTLRRPLRRTQR